MSLMELSPFIQSVQDFWMKFWPFLMYSTMFFLIFFGILILQYALKKKITKKNIRNEQNFRNEFLIGFLLIFDAIIYPFIYNNYTSDPLIRYEMFFNAWYNLSINLIIWCAIIISWIYYNKKQNKSTKEEELFEEFINKYEDNAKKDWARKKIHFLYGILVVGLFYIYVFLEDSFFWNNIELTIYTQVDILLNYLFIVLIFDIIRLMRFHWFGVYPKKIILKKLKDSEINTFTTASPLIVSVIPFLLWPYGPQLFWSVWLIAAISDAMANIVGKRFGKIRIRTGKKTIEGYISGFFTTFLIVLTVNSMIPFPNLQMLDLVILALISSFAFLLVDIGIFSKKITDNFLNPIVCGIFMVISYQILILF